MRTLHVPGEYPTIQSAVDAAGVSDRILVAAGTYVESVVIDAGKEGLEIRGAGNRSVLAGRRRAEIGFAIRTASSVTIRGFAITHFTTAGMQIDTSGNVVEAVTINADGGRFGLVVVDGAQGNLLVGIAVAGSSEAAIVLDGANTLLTDSVVGQNGRTGVVVSGSGNRLFGNIIGLNGENGITVSGSGNLLASNRSARNQGAGIVLGARVTGNVISGNRVTANDGPGIQVDPAAAGNVIVANVLRRNHPDLVAERPAQANNALRANRCRSSIPPGLCRND